LFYQENETNYKEIKANAYKKEINTSKYVVYTNKIKIKNEKDAINVLFFAFNHSKKNEIKCKVLEMKKIIQKILLLEKIEIMVLKQNVDLYKSLFIIKNKKKLIIKT